MECRIGDLSDLIPSETAECSKEKQARLMAYLSDKGYKGKEHKLLADLISLNNKKYLSLIDSLLCARFASLYFYQYVLLPAIDADNTDVIQLLNDKYMSVKSHCAEGRCYGKAVNVSPKMVTFLYRLGIDPRNESHIGNRCKKALKEDIYRVPGCSQYLKILDGDELECESDPETPHDLYDEMQKEMELK